jgi:hypothetical protein
MHDNNNVDEFHSHTMTIITLTNFIPCFNHAMTIMMNFIPCLIMTVIILLMIFIPCLILMQCNDNKNVDEFHFMQ